MIIFISLLIFLTLLICFFIFKPLSKISYALIIFIIAFSATSYYFLGDSKGLKNYQRVQAELKAIHNPQQMISQLQQHLMANPTSAQGWFLLGSLYMDTQQYLLAQTVFEKSYILKPNNASYAAAYAQARYFNHHQTLDAPARAALNVALNSDKNNIAALNLLAIDAYHRRFR